LQSTSPDSAPFSAQQSSLIIATAGHVDHGKTALVKALTGIDTDTLGEEKARGLTINLGFAYSRWPLPDTSPEQHCLLGFIDVPGHRDFIHNMLAGVSAIDLALIVVAADDGIMPQTREHITILKLLNVSRAVVAITKTDLCDSETVTQLEHEIASVLRDSSLADARVVPTSSISNTGIDTLRQCLLETAATRHEYNAADPERHFRFQVDRSFSVKGIGTVVTGATISGKARPDDVVTHSRTGSDVRIRGLRVDKESVAGTGAGERAALNLSTLSREDLKRGDWLLERALHHPTLRFDAHLHWLSPQAPKPGVPYHLHIGAAHYQVNLRQLGSGESQFFQLRCQESLFCHYGDRFIIRDPTGRETLGGGVVVDTFVPRRKRASRERLDLLDALHQPNDRTALAAALEVAPGGIELDKFRLCRNLTSGGLEQIIIALHDGGSKTSSVADREDNAYLFSRAHFEALAKKVLNQVRSFHQQQPDKPGVSETVLFRDSEFLYSMTLFQAVIDKLVALELLHRTGGDLHLPDHRHEASPEEKLFLRKIQPLLAQAGRIPPRTHELVDSTGMPLKQIEAILKQACRSGRLIKVADNRHFLPETLDDLARFTEQLADQQTDGGFSVIQFRDASGIGRNLCIEILEHFDRMGLTRRDENLRFLRKPGSQQAANQP
jgi:selenocysteine-specific elongation factor